MSTFFRQLTSHQFAIIGSSSQSAYGIDETVSLSGTGDLLVGGNENFSASGVVSNSFLMLGNGADTINLIGNGNVVELGEVQVRSVTGPCGTGLTPSQLNISYATDFVSLSGTGNTLWVAGAVDATLIGSSNTLMFGDPGMAAENSHQAAPAPVSVALIGSHEQVIQDTKATSGSGSVQADIFGGSGCNYVSVVGNASISLGGLQNTIIAGGGTASGSQFTIYAGSGNDHVVLREGTDAHGATTTSDARVHLVGIGNQVTGGSNVLVSGGSGNETLMLGDTHAQGSFNVNLSGIGNNVTLQNGTVVGLNAGSGSDTVRLLNANGNLTFHGASNMLFIGGNAPGAISISDQSNGLAIDLRSNPSAPLIISGNDQSLLIDLALGIGSLNNAVQIMQNLHSDGAGGTLLSSGIGSHSTTLIHFVGSNHITAANFTFG